MGDQAERRTRVGAYAVCVDPSGRLLLCRMSSRTKKPGAFTLPGGGVRHGEHPEVAVLRELAEETGIRSGRVTGLAGVHSNVYEIDGVSIHGVRLLYEVAIDDGTGTRSEEEGSTDGAAWLAPADLPGLELSAHARYALRRWIADG